ncbi:MAG: hypothetical protein MZV63_14560 [Marinilabiliales bacterium]|nr:hypothetical protein [Marinilabiliales bacterium]
MGVTGLLYQLNRDNKNWWIVMLLLFIMTGIAIVFYLNQYPNQPRERDYAYAGSFYFLVDMDRAWGAGCFRLAIRKLYRRKTLQPLLQVLSALVAVPVLMGTRELG